jgi:hypothetical protein
MNSQQSETPGQVLSRLLAERGWGKTDFAAKLAEHCKVSCEYRNVHRWTKDKEFNEKNQTNAARTLGVSRDIFQSPDLDLERRLRVERTLEKARRNSQVIRDLDPEAYQVLRTITFESDRILPTVAFFESVAYALRSLIRDDEIVPTAVVNARLDESLAHKPPLRPRKKQPDQARSMLSTKRRRP